MTTTRETDDNGQIIGTTEQPKTAREEEKGELSSCSASLEVDANQNKPQTVRLVLINVKVQRYEGETREGQFHGGGLACFEGGHVYKGMFSKGLMHGWGVFTQAGGLKCEGQFEYNMAMGQGTYTWPDGSSYTGEVYNGLRHGTGTYKCVKTSLSYRGQWDQGKQHGKGVVYYNRDKTSWYKGDWVKNNREGCGVRCYPSGNVYSGEWKNNQRHGEGTMKWLKLGQQYVGTWQNGVQHGRGTHVWILRQTDGRPYIQNNQYTGDFVQGQRHGQGTFYYANGAIYEGEWRNNKRHGKGKFTLDDGRVFEAELADDQMVTHNLEGSRDLIPLCGAFPLSVSDSSMLRPDMVVNIDSVLDVNPEKELDFQCKREVEFAVLRQVANLRSIYSFYSKLGHAHFPHSVYQLSRLQLWRLLKDCNIHHHGVTLTQVDRYIREYTTTAEIHSPFTTIPLHKFHSCLLVIAYHIYQDDMALEKHQLAACFTKLMTDNILPNAENVKGFLFRKPHCAVVAERYVERCWEIYQTFCEANAAPTDDLTMTCRHLLWMYKDLNLLDNNLTSARLLQIITAESPDPGNLSSCLDLEITFLEFLEVLWGSVEVKCPQGPEVKSSSHSLMVKSSDTAGSSNKTRTNKEPPAANQRGQKKAVEAKNSQMEAKDRELKLWTQLCYQFFEQSFFPAYEQNQPTLRHKGREDCRLPPTNRRRQHCIVLEFNNL